MTRMLADDLVEPMIRWGYCMLLLHASARKKRSYAAGRVARRVTSGFKIEKVR